MIDAETVGVARDAAMAHLRQAMSASGAGPRRADQRRGGGRPRGVVARRPARGRRCRGADHPGPGAGRRGVRRAGGARRRHEGRPARCPAGRGGAIEAEVSANREALLQVADARLKLHALAATELSLAEEHDDRLVQRESAQVLADLAQRRRDGVDLDESSVLAARVPRGVGGPIPIVVVMGDAPPDRLDRLTVFPDDVQILLIGDGDGVDAWIAAAGPEAGSVIDVGSLV
ncbi:MAG: hypothetical protein R2695_15830 [Acidimicrobiales bacterium]